MPAVRGRRRGRDRGVDRGISRGVAWTLDATSGKAVPATTTEWNALIAAAGLSKSAPTSIWAMQEAAGLPQDTNGADHFSAFGGGGAFPSYQNAVPGWTRKSINFTDGSTRYMFGTVNQTGSYKLLLLLSVSAATSGSTILYSKGEYGFAAGPLNQVRFGAPGAGVFASGAYNPTGAVRPLLFTSDETNSIGRFADNAEVLLPAYTAADAQIFLGAAIGASAGFEVLYAAGWAGAAAEGWSTADEKALLQRMGWTIPW